MASTIYNRPVRLLGVGALLSPSVLIGPRLGERDLDALILMEAL